MQIGEEKTKFENMTMDIVFQSFKSAQVESRDGEKLVQSMADDIHSMMELKISAVKRIVEAAENMAFDKQNEPVPDDFQFFNSKEMEEPLVEFAETTTTVEPEFVIENIIARPPTKNVHLVPNSHFSDIPVNVNFSSIHVPTNVYSWGTFDCLIFIKSGYLLFFIFPNCMI